MPRSKVVVEASDFELVKAVVPVTEAGKRPDANEVGKGMVHLKLDLLPLAILDQGDTYTFTDVVYGVAFSPDVSTSRT
jgi:hypothetical protein